MRTFVLATAKKLVSATETLGLSLVMMLMLLMFGNIVVREVFGYPLVWANEVSLILFSWTVFLGSAVAFSRNGRIRFDFIRERLPKRFDRLLDILATCLGLGGLTILMLIGVRLVVLNWSHRLTSIDASAAWHWACLPVGAAVALVGWIAADDNSRPQ